jgi:hypothetical protein
MLTVWLFIYLADAIISKTFLSSCREISVFYTFIHQLTIRQPKLCTEN